MKNLIKILSASCALMALVVTGLGLMGCDNATSPSPPPEILYTVSGSISTTPEGGKVSGIIISLKDNAGTSLFTALVDTSAKTYTITSVPAGTYTLSAVLTGYETFSDSITVSDNTTQDITLVRCQVATPVAFPPAGEVVADITVLLSTSTEGALIYYTANGDMPSENSTPYTCPITIGEDVTIKAIAVKDGWTTSDILTADYTTVSLIDALTALLEELPPGTLVVPAGVNISDNWVTIIATVTSVKYIILDLSGCTATDNTITGKISPSNNDFNIFKDNTYIKGIILPETLASIGERAFSACKNLTSITIPDSVSSIGQYAFFNCSSLTSITIPDSVNSIGNYAFSNCSSLTSITIPDSVNSIGQYAFVNCSSLTSVTIPDSVNSIGNSAFSGCSSLTSVTIPDSVNSIGNSAFSGCSSLTSITIPDSVNSIGDYTFKECKKLENITIPNSVNSIGQYAFQTCTSLTNIIIPDSVSSIGQYAFSGSGLTSVTFAGSNTPVSIASFPYGASLQTAGGATSENGYKMEAGTYTLSEKNWTKSED